MDIYLLRHGETDWNKKQLLQGHTDIPLNERGRAQVEDTVRRLRALDMRMDAVVSSPLKRARETAEIAARILEYPQEKIVVEDLLIERGFGEGEGMLLEEMKAQYPDSDCPGMESKEALVRRDKRQRKNGLFQGKKRKQKRQHSLQLLSAHFIYTRRQKRGKQIHQEISRRKPVMLRSQREEEAEPVINAKLRSGHRSSRQKKDRNQQGIKKNL